jgi:hypothetical protein
MQKKINSHLEGIIEDFFNYQIEKIKALKKDIENAICTFPLEVNEVYYHLEQRRYVKIKYIRLYPTIVEFLEKLERFEQLNYADAINLIVQFLNSKHNEEIDNIIGFVYYNPKTKKENKAIKHAYFMSKITAHHVEQFVKKTIK